MKKTKIIIPIIIGLVVAWHVVVCLSMNNEYYDVNPLTDVATLKLPGAAAYGITDPAEATGFKWGRALTGVPAAEYQLNLYARKYLDLYALIIPYRVSIIDK